MEAVMTDISSGTSLPYGVILARLLGAALLVSGIGFERELKDRAAGLRTHMLVSAAAAMFAILAIEVADLPHFKGDYVQLDPLRIIEAVTAGVAFLSAGFILVNRGRVQGVTTGAGIWLAAATGLAVGFGYWSIAFAAAILGLIIIAVVRRLESFLGHKP